MKILDVPQSGSIAGVTSSKNRYGQYRRTRAIPVNPNTSFQSEARTRLADQSSAYKALTDVQREGWISLGAQMQRTDSLGQTYNLTGTQAFVCVNSLLLAAGEAILTAAPAFALPAALDSITITATAAALSIAFTPTPLGADEFLFVYASPQRSAGRAFESDFRLVHASAAAAATPANIFAAYQARFGTPVVGNRIFISVQRMKNGLLSTALNDSKVVA